LSSTRRTLGPLRSGLIQSPLSTVANNGDYLKWPVIRSQVQEPRDRLGDTLLVLDQSGSMIQPQGLPPEC
jgi:hypothetical protein